MNNDDTLLEAINSLNKKMVDKQKGKTDLNNFMLAHSKRMSPEALLFLRDNYKISLKYIFSRIDVTVEQMKILLQEGYKPSKHMILTYSAYFDLSLFKMLFVYGVDIPEEVVWKWDNPIYVNALKYYLDQGGNPNIRPFIINSKRIGIYEPSLIDKWVMMQSDTTRDENELKTIDSIVAILTMHGAKKSPYAMTEKERKEYVCLQRNNPEQFIINVQQKIAKIQDDMKNIQNDIEYNECLIAIDNFETDMQMCNQSLN